MTPHDSLSQIESRLRYLWCADGLTRETAPPEILAIVRESDDQVDNLLAKQMWNPASPEHGNALGPNRPQTPETIGLYENWYCSIPASWSVAWANPLSRHYKNPHLLERIEAALAYVEPLIRPDSPRHGAWYMWDIGYPHELAQTLVLCGRQMDPSLRERLETCLIAMPSKVFATDRNLGIVKSLHAGANTMHILENTLVKAVALNDPAWLDAAAKQVLIAVGRGEDGQGVQDDWSYHFHGRGVNAGYGLTSAGLQALWIFLTHGTPWQVGEEILRMHLGTLREFFRFNVWKGRNSPFSMDRGIAGPDGITARGVFAPFALGLLSGFSPEDQTMCAGAALECLSEDMPLKGLVQTRLEHDLLPKVKELAQPYLGVKYYPDSEYLLCHRPKWFAAVRLSSVRTKGWNSQNGQHAYGSSGAEFSIALMSDGHEYTISTIPSMNWRRLMGVTRTDAVENPPEGYGKSDFAGGLADQELGVMGIQYLLAPQDQDTLRANKSLFIARDALVLLGSRIRSDADEPVETTLFHAPIPQGAPFKRNGAELDSAVDGEWEIAAGEWLLLNNVAVKLLEPATLQLTTRTGTYNQMNMIVRTANEGPGAVEHTHRWFYLIARHGLRPRDASYGAVLYPAVEPDFVPSADELEIKHEPYHHMVAFAGGEKGAEVRFPMDYRKPGGLSYPGAEPFKWGSISRWSPAEEPNRYDIEIFPPQRYMRNKEANTELFLPDGFEAEKVTLISMEGKLFPGNLISTRADGESKFVKAKRVGSE